MADWRHVLTLDPISPLGLSRLPAERYETAASVAAPDVILVRSHDMHGMEIPASVKAIGRAGAGTNNIPVAAMSQRGVPVFNAPGANANAVKELVLAALLMAARNLAPAIRFVEGLDGDGEALRQQVEHGKKQFAGVELPNRRLGVIGLGAIGGLVADAALSMGMRVQGFDPNITVEAAWRLSAQVKQAQHVDALVRESEFITLHVPLLEMTRHLINAERVAMMQPGAVVLNFSRDGVVDEEAVLAGIAAGNIKYYLCDFPSRRLRGQPGVVALPHLGASTQEAEEHCAIMVADQVRDYLEHGNIRNAVNFPTVEMVRESPHRLAVAHANVPNMVARISTAMADAGLNIHNMVNKSKGEMAYTLLDVDSPPNQTVIGQVAAIPGVLMVRFLPT